MHRLVFETVIRCSQQELWDFHASVSALTKLTPPGTHVIILSDDTAVTEGNLHVLRVKKMGIPIVWKARIHEVTPPSGFTDTAEKSPFARWTHRHAFLETPEGTLLRDTVEYQLPGGPLGVVVNALVVERDLKNMFRFRHQVTKAELERRLGP